MFVALLSLSVFPYYASIQYQSVGVGFSHHCYHCYLRQGDYVVPGICLSVHNLT